MSWIIFFVAALFLLALAVILYLVWDNRPPEPEIIQGERRISFLNYYPLTEGVPTADDVACLRTCEASYDCGAVWTNGSGRTLTCDLINQQELAQLSLERLLVSPGFVQQNVVPLPSDHVYFGKGVYSTNGRYWIKNRRHRVNRVVSQELLSYQQLPWRPQSIVAPEGAIGIYSAKLIPELALLHPTEWYVLEGVLPVYIHRAGEPLQVPVYWKTPWVVYA